MYCHASLWNRQTYHGAWQTINTRHCHALPCMTAPCIFSSHVLPCIVEQGFFLENDKDMRCHVLPCANKCNTWEYMVPNQLFVFVQPNATMRCHVCAAMCRHAPENITMRCHAPAMYSHAPSHDDVHYKGFIILIFIELS